MDPVDMVCEPREKRVTIIGNHWSATIQLEATWVDEDAEQMALALQEVSGRVRKAMVELAEQDGKPRPSVDEAHEIFPVFEFGKGLIAIHPGQYKGVHCIVLGRRGAAGMSLLEDAPSARFLKPEDTLAILTFAKAEAVDTLIESLRLVKLRMLGIHMPEGNA